MSYFANINLPVLLILGGVIVAGFYFGRNMRYLRLPSIIGFMILGVFLGTSFLNIIPDSLNDKLGFIPDIALGFVALSIGLELKFSHIKKLGKSIVYIIILESFGAFIIVFGAIYMFTGDIILAIILAAIAPASAPAGTVAIIREYKAKGNLTKALYAVVGFDDGLGIIIFGFASAIAQSIIISKSGGPSYSVVTMILHPLKEVGLSFLIGSVTAFFYSLLVKKLRNPDDILIITFGFIFAVCGLCQMEHLSLILTCMVFGMFIVNTQSNNLIMKIQERLSIILPLLFILFFTLAGASLHLKSLPSLGLLGIVYILSRSAGLIGGSRIGAIIGKSDEMIKKYLGLGILSQAGVAIGLTILVKQNFEGLGSVVSSIDGIIVTSGDQLGTIVLTTVTATCIVFEIVGPILTKIGLTKAGEIDQRRRK